MNGCRIFLDFVPKFYVVCNFRHFTFRQGYVYPANFSKTMIWIFLNLVLSIATYHSSLLDIKQGTSLTILSMPKQAQKTPIVEWLTERDHDFQHLRQEHPKTFVFKFKNIDTAPILLQTVRTSCGCTAATWTEEAIPSGGTGQIEVEYDAYQRGEFRKKIRVFFDRQKKPEILYIHGEVD